VNYCNPACNSLTSNVGCYTDAAGAQTPVIIHSVYQHHVNAAGQSAVTLVQTVITDALGNALDTSGGKVSPGACKQLAASGSGRDDEFVRLCLRLDGQPDTPVVVKYSMGENDQLFAAIFTLDGTPIIESAGVLVPCESGSCHECPTAPRVLGVTISWGQ
jgi:hypothetical protein